MFVEAQVCEDAVEILLWSGVGQSSLRDSFSRLSLPAAEAAGYSESPLRGSHFFAADFSLAEGACGSVELGALGRPVRVSP